MESLIRAALNRFWSFALTIASEQTLNPLAFSEQGDFLKGLAHLKASETPESQFTCVVGSRLSRFATVSVV